MTDSVIGALRIDLTASSAELDQGLRESIGAMEAFALAAQKEMSGLADVFAKGGDESGQELISKLHSSADKIEGTVFGAIEGLVGRLPGIWGKIGALGLTAAKEMWSQFEPMLSAKLSNTLFDVGVWDTITESVARVGGAVGGLTQRLAEGVTGGVLAWRNSIIEAWNGSEGIFSAIANANYAAFFAPFEPAIAAIGKWLGTIGEAWSSAPTALTGIRDALHAGFVQPIIDASEALKRWGAAIAEAWRDSDGVLSGIGNAITKGLTYPFQKSTQDLIENDDASKVWANNIRERMKTAGEAVKGFLRQRAGINDPEEGPEIKAPKIAAEKEEIDHAARFNRRLQEQIGALEVEASTLGMSAEARARANAELRLTNLIRKEGLVLSAEEGAEIRKSIDQLAEQAKATEQARRSYQQFQATVDTFKNAISSSFDKLIAGTFKFKDALADLGRSLAKLFLNQALTGLFGGGGTTGAFNLAGLFGFGGNKASGGNVSPDRWYRVNEMGQELFKPDVPGRLIPAHEAQKASGGGSVYAPITINAPGADAAALARVEAEVRQLNRTFEGRAVSAFIDARGRRMIR